MKDNKQKIMKDNKQKIKLFLTDFDGVLTDGGIYYSADGEFAKRFHVHDGMGLEMLTTIGIPTGIVTSDNSEILNKRAERLGFRYVIKGKNIGRKLPAIIELCNAIEISLEATAYMGDDVNCYDLLAQVGYPACPADAQGIIKNIPNIYVTHSKGGNGALREWINYLLNQGLFDTDKSISSLIFNDS